MEDRTPALPGHVLVYGVDDRLPLSSALLVASQQRALLESGLSAGGIWAIVLNLVLPGGRPAAIEE